MFSSHQTSRYSGNTEVLLRYNLTKMCLILITFYLLIFCLELFWKVSVKTAHVFRRNMEKPLTFVLLK